MKDKVVSILLHTILILGALSMIFPFLWMISTSFKSPTAALKFPPSWFPSYNELVDEKIKVGYDEYPLATFKDKDNGKEILVAILNKHKDNTATVRPVEKSAIFSGDITIAKQSEIILEKKWGAIPKTLYIKDASSSNIIENKKYPIGRWIKDGRTITVAIIEKTDKVLKVRPVSTKPHLTGEKFEANLSDLKPKKRIWGNYIEAWEAVPFTRYFINTIIMCVAILIGNIVTSALAAYAFAKMEFHFREIIFLLFLSMMMVPEPVYLLPSYIILAKLHWIDTFWALIIPWSANVFSIFLLRQHFKSIPDDLYDAALIDGCSRFSFLWRVIMPISKAVLVTVGLFSIIGSWNSFMWPLVVTNDESMRVIQVGLSYFAQEAGTQWTLMMAASTFCIIPLVIVFFFAQRQIIESFAQSGLKG